MAFRGTIIKEQDVTNWNQKIGSYLSVPGLSSTSKYLGKSLEFCTPLTATHLQQGKKAFLFVFVVARRTLLFHLDTEEYTAYPGEGEVLLREGILADVLGREELYSSRFV